MKKMQQHNKKSLANTGIFFGLGIFVGLISLVSVARLTWHSKFYPGVTIANIQVAGLNREQAREKLVESTNDYRAKLTFNGSSWQAPSIAVEFDLESTLNNAYHYGRRVQIGDYLLLLVNRKTNFPLILNEGKTDKLETFINELAGVVEITPVEPTIELSKKEIKVINGSDGTVLDLEKFDREIRDAYSNLDEKTIEIPTKVARRELKIEDLDLIKKRAETLIAKDLELVVEDSKIKLRGDELIAFLATDGSSNIFNKDMMKEYVAGLSKSHNREAQDAKFEFVDGKVKEFAPGKDGITIEVDQTVVNLEKGIQTLLDTEEKTQTVSIAVTRVQPKVTTDKVNELGIKERIGRGESYYAHSIPNRIYNVGLASARANSSLVPPGEEFSFNAAVGDISAASGYRSAYVISGGRTVLGDGGGVCQVSTTFFRAAMNAGLPITERWAHAYRVGYYEQNSKAGIDATIYSPSKDLKFKNDTPGHILIQTINDPKNTHLVVEIYGTSDGRVATVTEPKVWGVSPPPPDIVQDDPSLPTGTTKQVDWSAWGAKASFDYKVTRGGETIFEKTFTSTFKPWANVYLKGTGQ